MERGRGMGLMPGSGYGIELRRLKLRHSQLEKDVAAAKIAIREEESARRPMANELMAVRKDIWRYKREAEEAKVNLRKVVMAASSARRRDHSTGVEVSEDGRYFKLPVYVSSSALQQYADSQQQEIRRLENELAQQTELRDQRLAEVAAQTANVLHHAKSLQSLRLKEMQVMPHPAGDLISHWPPVQIDGMSPRKTRAA